MTHTCTSCHQPIPAGLAVLRGNGHELGADHRGCSPSFTSRYLAARSLVPERIVRASA